MKRHRVVTVAVMAALVIAVGSFFVGNRTARSETPAKDKENSPDDRAAIRQVMSSFIEAFQKGDAAAAAGFMTAEAEVIPDEGDTIKGRETIQKAYANYFTKNPKTKITLEPEELRFPSRD